MKESPAMLAVRKARIRMITPSRENRMIWFGNLAMRLRIEEREDIETMAVNGTTLFFNPAFSLALSKEQMNFTMAHEVMHCALLHPYRFEKAESKYRGLFSPKVLHKLSNIAADFVVNASLIECQDPNLVPPKNIIVNGKVVFTDVCYDTQYSGKTFEQVLAELVREVQEHPQGGGGKGQALDNIEKPKSGSGDSNKDKEGNGSGGIEGGMSEDDWKVAVQESTKGLSAGKIPGNITRNLDAAHESEVPWRSILHKFIVHTIPHDFTWRRPNRRFIQAGLYLPGTQKENMGEIALFIDCSGSITDEWLQEYAAHALAICQQCKPEKVHIIYFDSIVSHHDVYTGNYSGIKLGAHGGGGTSFQPMFDFVASAENKVKPIAALVFTDLFCSDNPEPPPYPVLWVVPKANSKLDFKFGRVLPV